MLGLSDTAGAINELPDIGMPETTIATGTMGATADPQHIPQQSVHETVQFSATASEQDTIINDCPEDSNQLESAKLSDDMQLGATSDEKAGEGTRTLDIQLGKLTTHFASADDCSTSKRAKSNPSSSVHDSDLGTVIDTWPMLNDSVKDCILAIVNSTSENQR